ncbi:hypothetical protein [Nostoc sp. UHCC 0251]|nr:hypothetical protein [Nostoc sp. UHCC 0251]MEA5627134.1 hypothetical protein [Nostoc sp. UHCC 0251]
MPSRDPFGDWLLQGLACFPNPYLSVVLAGEANGGGGKRVQD